MKTLAEEQIASLRTNSLSSVVESEIERQILSGETPPGAKLIEAALAQRLGVSRGPVREAMRKLEEAGLIFQQKNRGAFVRFVPLDEALELFEVREMIEERAVRRLCLTAGADGLKPLQAILEAMRIAAGAANADSYHALNLEFHDALVSLGGNRKLVSVYRGLIKQLTLVRRISLDATPGLPGSIAEHSAIVSAIEARDADKAAALVRRHVHQSCERMKRMADVTPEA